LTSICDIVFVDGGGKCEGEDGIAGVRKFIFGSGCKDEGEPKECSSCKL